MPHIFVSVILINVLIPTVQTRTVLLGFAAVPVHTASSWQSLVPQYSFQGLLPSAICSAWPHLTLGLLRHCVIYFPLVLLPGEMWVRNRSVPQMLSLKGTQKVASRNTDAPHACTLTHVCTCTHGFYILFSRSREVYADSAQESLIRSAQPVTLEHRCPSGEERGCTPGPQPLVCAPSCLAALWAWCWVGLWCALFCLEGLSRL